MSKNGSKCIYLLAYAFKKLLSLQDNAKWPTRDHVKKDLDPYVCLFQECNQPDGLYKHIEDWLSHMRQHSQCWRCSSHRELGSFTTREKYIQHMRYAHDPKLGESKLHALAKRNARGMPKLFSSCPLCGKDESGIGVRLTDHIAGHLRSLAIKSLPSYKEDIGDVESEDDSSESLHFQGEDTFDLLDDEHERRFREACREIKDIKRHFDESEVNGFFTKYGDVVNQRSNKTMTNLLHTIVDVVTHNEVQPKHIEILIRRVVEKFPDLLTHSHEEVYNPIFMAIKASHNELVDYIVTTCSSMKRETLHGQSLNQALSMKMKDGKNCLHLAIEKQLRPRTIKALIEHASDEALAVQDENGRTPMHHATLFESCTDTGIELINLFLERDLQIRQSKLSPPKTFLDVTDNGGASVYWQLQTNTTSALKAYEQWLVKQRSSADSIKSQPHVPREHAKESLIGNDTPQRGSRLPGSIASAQFVDKYGQDHEANITDYGEKERGMMRDDDLTQPAMLTMGAKIKKRGTEDRNTSQDRSSMPNGHYAGSERPIDDRKVSEVTPNISLKRRGTENIGTARGREEDRLASNSAPKKPESSEFMPVLIKNSNAILLDLKIHYMRTRNTELATSFLHGANMQGKIDRLWVNFYNRKATNMWLYIYISSSTMMVYQENCFGTNFLSVSARPRVVASPLTMYFNM